MSQAKEVSRRSCRVLTAAIYHKDGEKIERLVTRGSNVNGADYNGNTPLHHAVASRDVEIVRLIIELGGDVNAANDAHLRPYDVALNDNFIEAMELLLKSNSVISNVDISVSHLPRHITDLIYGKIDLQARNAEGHAILHIATAKNDVYAVRRLLSRGADTQVRTAYRKESPLHLAISQEISELLLDYGASINATDRYTCMPLSTVAMKSHKKVTTRQEQSRIIELLIARGAEVRDVLVIAESQLDYNDGFDGMHGLKDILKFMGLREDEENFRKRINCVEFSMFYHQVLAEVSKMKDATFYCNVSFYHFLLKSWRRLTSYIDDMRVADVIVKDNDFVDHLASRFPLYFAIIMRHIDAANERYELRENAAISITVACPRLESFRVVVDNILTFLKIEDMKVIVKTYDVL